MNKILSKLNQEVEINFKPGDLLVVTDKSSKKKTKYKGICIGIKKRKLSSTVKIRQSQKGRSGEDNYIDFTFPINKKVFDIEVMEEKPKINIRRGKLYYLKIKI